MSAPTYTQDTETWCDPHSRPRDECDCPMPGVMNRIKTGEWLDAQHFPALTWVVPGIIPEGFGLLTGAPKIGKSWVTLDTCLAVASGGLAFGAIPIGDPRPVLLLALEDGDRRLQARARKLLQDQPIPGLLHYLTTATAAEVFEVIAAWLEQYGDQAPLIVLDTLGKVMPPTLQGESAYQRDYRIGGDLKALADRHPGSSLSVVHHTRKAQAEDWMDSTSGTNGLNGSADYTVALTRARSDNSGTIKVAGRDVPEGEYALTVGDGRWELDGTSLDDAAQAAQAARATEGLGDQSARIVAHVTAQPQPVPPTKQVADALGIPEARRYLTRLADAGRLQRESRGLYTSVPTVPVSQPEETPPDEWDTPTPPLSQPHTPSDLHKHTQRDTGTQGTPPTETPCTECGDPTNGPPLMNRCAQLHTEHP